MTSSTDNHSAICDAITCTSSTYIFIEIKTQVQMQEENHLLGISYTRSQRDLSSKYS